MRSVMLVVLGVLGACLLLPAMADDSQPKSIEVLELEEFLLEGTLWERVERAAQQKSIQCMRAFPHQQFCRCLGNQLPMVLTIAQYTAIVTTSREQIGYEGMSSEEKKVIDITRESRETCAAETM